MAVSPVGNAIYVNQNMHVAASKQNDQLNRFEIQNFYAANAANEKDKVIQQVRPTEESHEINPDKEQNKQNDDKSKKSKPKDDKIDESTKKDSIHILDIMV